MLKYMMQFSINSIDLCCFATHVIQMKNLYYHRNMTKSVSLSCSTTRNTFDYMHLLLYQLSEHPKTFPTFNISSQFNFVQHCFFFPCFQLRNLVWHVQDSWSFSIGLRISSLNVSSHHHIEVILLQRHPLPKTCYCFGKQESG